jgi:methylglyoxal synthase
MRSEKTWARRDDYALQSMAQTRATSKALRLPLGFVMQIAGYDATPAEEIREMRTAPDYKPMSDVDREMLDKVLAEARVVDPDPAAAIDAAIYLIDPVDPSSTFPEAVALKRQCVIHGKPFISTLLGAREWFELQAVEAGNEPNRVLDPVFDFGSQSIALVAHDARKAEKIAMVREHFDFFDRFASRVATGTTGGLLNSLAAEIRPDRQDPWVRALRSGPMGGDAQIAELLLDGACQRVLFLEDPHVARQHEADIQLLERAARTVGDRVACFADLASARAWIAGCGRRRG